MASTHTVRAGETLSGIAAQSGESLARVEADNPQITNPNVITVGELVHMWGGTGTLAPLRTKSGSTKASTSQGSTSQGSTTQAGDSQASSTQTGDSQSSSTAAGTSSSAAPSSFQQCVAWRESSNTPTDPDGLYGILPSTWQSLGYSGTAGQASVAQQNEAFNRLYSQDGTSPWSAYDGC
ncbi:MAG: LysM peptidoglycan-binding domain-containing protein [Streptosporangiaceae bacterium]